MRRPNGRTSSDGWGSLDQLNHPPFGSTPHSNFRQHGQACREGWAVVPLGAAGLNPRIAGQPPGTGFPEAETGAENGPEVSAETDNAEISAKKARHTGAILGDLHLSENYQSGWWVRQGSNL